MSCVAVVPIKTNNVRLPGKNIRLLAGRPLYEHVWDVLSRCKNVDRVMIDSSDQGILAAGRTWGFETSARDPALNGPDAQGDQLLQAIMPRVSEDIVAQVFVTTPLVLPGTIDAAIAFLDSDSSIGSVVPVYAVHDRFWFRERPVSHDPSRLVGTQFMEPLFRELGFYVFRREAFLSEGCRVTSKRRLMEVDHANVGDIDTDADFRYVEAILESRGRA